MQPMVFALTRADYENLLAELAVKNDPLSLPVRSMIFFTIIGSIRKCYIFVDSWPTYSVIACVQETQEYVGKKNLLGSHPDFVALYAETPRKSSDKAARMLPGFLEELAHQRKWIQRGVILSAISDKLYTHIKNVFKCPTIKAAGKINGALYYPALEQIDQSDESSEQFCQTDDVKVLSLGPFRMQVYNTQNEIHQNPLPEGYRLDTLRKEDIDTVLAHCHQKSDFPQPDRHLRWLIKHFPSACVRDQSDKPISWILTYQNGCAAMKFTLPEHRSQGYGRHVTRHALAQHTKRFATPRWKFDLSEEIKPKEAKKAPTNMVMVDTKVYWCLVKPRTDK